MQAAIDRVLEAYSLIEALSPEDEVEARRLLVEHLADNEGDENALAVEGPRFLRRRR